MALLDWKAIWLPRDCSQAVSESTKKLNTTVVMNTLLSSVLNILVLSSGCMAVSSIRKEMSMLKQIGMVA